MRKFLVQFARDESGATMVEYALIAGLVSVVAIAGLTDIGDEVNKTWLRIRECTDGTPGAACTTPQP